MLKLGMIGAGFVAKFHCRALARYGPVDGELLAVALLEEAAGTTLRHPSGAG